MSLLPEGTDILYGANHDTLISDQEADIIIEKISSEEYIDTVKRVIQELHTVKNAGELHSKEMFFISSRADIVEALTRTTSQVDSLLGGNENGNVLLTVVMILALNRIIVAMADNRGFKNIYHSTADKKYIIGVKVNKKSRGSSRRYGRNGKEHTLREALAVRRDLLGEQKQARDEAKRKLNREKAYQGLIEKGLLIRIGEEGDNYRVAYVRLKGSIRHSSQRFCIDRTISGKKISIQRSTSEHGNKGAFDQVVDELVRELGLLPLEQRILREEQHSRLVNYKEIKK